VKNFFRKLFKFLGYTAVIVVVALAIAHFAWKYSGSNTWEKVFEKNGVTVYALKEPGYTLKRFKAVTHVNTTLTRAVAAMASTDAEDCDEWAPGCKSEKAIQPFNAQDLTYTHLFRLAYPKPFAPREFLIHAHITQDMPSKSVLVDFHAEPDAIPHNDGYFRIPFLHNTWRFTPGQKGDVVVEATMNTDQGVPYVIVNKVVPYGLYDVCHNLQAFLDKPKWNNAKFAQIAE
jgi:hypothetical protein